MSDDELVGNVAQHIEAAFDERIAVYWKIIGPAALSIASPIIEREALEKAAKVADCFTSANIDPYQSGDVSFDRGYYFGVGDSSNLIAAAIRALMELSK